MSNYDLMMPRINMYDMHLFTICMIWYRNSLAVSEIKTPTKFHTNPIEINARSHAIVFCLSFI